MDMCQHVPKFITDKTCLGAPGDENIGKMWNKICEIGTRTDIVRWVDHIFTIISLLVGEQSGSGSGSDLGEVYNQVWSIQSGSPPHLLLEPDQGEYHQQENESAGLIEQINC